jgi:SAM-dependent methyltransferase
LTAEALKVSWNTLESLGVQRPITQRQYASRIEKRFGAVGTAFLDQVDRSSAGEQVNLYPYKNATLDLSLAVSSQCWSMQHAVLLAWLSQENLGSPQRILDVGCENGALSCAIARMFPNADVIGVDREPLAIERANELAARSRIANVRFVRSEFENFMTDDRSDLIIAAWMYHEASNAPPYDGIGFAIESEFKGSPERVAWLRRNGTLLSEGGLFIAVNRWGRECQTLQWVRECEAAGLELNLGRSCILQVDCKVNGAQKFPLTVHQSADPVSVVLPDDVLALHSYPFFRDNSNWLNCEGAAAEAIYRGLTITETVYRAELRYPDGTEILEVGFAGPLSVYYSTSSLGMRRIGVGAAISIPEFLEAAVSYVKERMLFVPVEETYPKRLSPRLKAYGIQFGEE